MAGVSLISSRKHRTVQCMIQIIYGLVTMLRKLKGRTCQRLIYGRLAFLAKT
nr:MAG TPA: hypothetical protein [Caudoviricetes sp.]